MPHSPFELPTPSHSPSKHTAFFYGTLMATPVLHRVLTSGFPPSSTPSNPQTLSVKPAILKGHTRYRVKGADYPALLPTPEGNEASAGGGTSVRGTLVSGLSDTDIWRLDIFEGDDYSRRRVKVVPLRPKRRAPSSAPPPAANQNRASYFPQKGDEQEQEEFEEDDREIEAETYIWIAGPENLEKGEWNFEEFVREKMGKWAFSGSGDQGFRDVEAAVAILEPNSFPKSYPDPTGGRGFNGPITRQLQNQAAVPPPTNKKAEEVIRSAV